MRTVSATEAKQGLAGVLDLAAACRGSLQTGGSSALAVWMLR